jgi:hypothetical protein
MYIYIYIYINVFSCVCADFIYIYIYMEADCLALFDGYLMAGSDEVPNECVCAPISIERDAATGAGAGYRRRATTGPSDRRHGPLSQTGVENAGPHRTYNK